MVVTMIWYKRKVDPLREEYEGIILNKGTGGGSLIIFGHKKPSISKGKVAWWYWRWTRSNKKPQRIAGPIDMTFDDARPIALEEFREYLESIIEATKVFPPQEQPKKEEDDGEHY